MSAVGVIRSASRLIKNGREPKDVLMALMEEVGELATEVAIDDGFKNKEPSEDGIVGEAIDVMLCALDVVFVAYPELTEKEINAITLKKCNKWLGTVL